MFGIIESQFQEFAEFNGILDEKYREFAKQDFQDMKKELEIIDEKVKKCEEILDDVRVYLGRISAKDDQFNLANKQLKKLDTQFPLIKNKQSNCHSTYISEKETQKKLKNLTKGAQGVRKEHLQITGLIDSDGQKLLNATRALGNANINVNETGQVIKSQGQNLLQIDDDIKQIKETLQKSEGILASARRNQVFKKLVVFCLIILFALIDVFLLMYKQS